MAAGVEVLHAQAHGGLVQQLVRDGPGAFGGALFGRHDVGVAERFLHAGIDGRAVVAGVGAAQPMVKAIAPDRIPQRVHAGAVEREQLLHGADAFGVQADFGPGADAGQVAQFQMSDRAGNCDGSRPIRPSGFCMSLAILAR